MATDWTAYGKKHLLNRKIVKVRYMTDAEVKGFGWTRKPIVLELDNGTVLYPSSDDEGNEAGTLFGTRRRTEDLTFPVL